jgi:hypothetical protein
MNEVNMVATDGRILELGELAAFRNAAMEILEFTGGSSLGGHFSRLWGMLTGPPEDPVSPEWFDHVQREAAQFDDLFGPGLSVGAKQLLKRLATQPGGRANP